MAEVAEGEAAGPAVPGWQARALDRSLADARARSVERMAGFVAAARDLATESGSSGFTVQQVVARAGSSLKSFYRVFGGKDDLLLALLEEDLSVGAAFLTEMVDAHRSPARRIERWVTGLFELMAAGEDGYVGVLVREHRRFTEERPEELAVALAPFLELLAGELAAGMDAGVVRRGDPARDASTVFEVALARIHALVAGAGDDPAAEAAYVWSFCRGGLQDGAAGGRRS